MSGNVEVNFFFGAQLYASRAWVSVPRVGDEVMLRDFGKEEKVPFKVLRVVWGVERNPIQSQQCVNIEIERIE